MNWRKFEEFIRSSMETWKVPGCAVAVIHKGKTILFGGYGIRGIKDKSPVTTRTLFAIASCTKAFTAASVGIAVDEKKLDWHTPIRQYLPSFRLYDPLVAERITPRDLLTHVSGLPRHDVVWWDSSLTREEIIRRLQFLEPSKDFRTAWQYQNLMYMVAGYLVGHVYKMTWEKFVQERILDPLEMHSTNFSVEQSMKANDLACPHRIKKGRVTKSDFYTKLHVVGPAGNMNSTVEDMAKWVQFNLDEGKARNNTQLIATQTMQYIHSAHVVSEPSPFKEMPFLCYGLGWHPVSYRGYRFLSHGGNVGGFSCQTAFLPDEAIGVVVLTNLATSPLGKVLTYHAVDGLLGLSEIPWCDRFKKQQETEKKTQKRERAQKRRQRKKNTQISHPLASYAGDYHHPGYGRISITTQNNDLTATHNSKDFPLVHYHYDVFEKVDPTDNSRQTISFQTNVSGEIDSLSIRFESEIPPIVFTRAKRVQS